MISAQRSMSIEKSAWTLGVVFGIFFFLSTPYITDAATLSLSPATGVYTVGGTFSARIVVNTQNASINSA